MLPPHEQGPTLIDSGEFKSERFAFRGMATAWDDDDDDDNKETQMIPLPSDLPSQPALRVLPAVPNLWTPPPPPPSTNDSVPHIDAMCAERHWVPAPPLPRMTQPSAGSFTQVSPQPRPRGFVPPPPPMANYIVEEIAHGPDVAITLPTPRTRAKRQLSLRKVVLPWPAIVMMAAVAGGVIFEEAQRGDTLSAIQTFVSR